MLFKDLHPSDALQVVRYADIDQFHLSELYARAESIPLDFGAFNVMRASLRLASAGLSLVCTFPRLLSGYDLPGRLIVVVPMNGVSSTRLNGVNVEQSLILVKGKANCTVLEPEGRLVAILSVDADGLVRALPKLVNGHLLLQTRPNDLADLQQLILRTIEVAARDPQAIAAADTSGELQDRLFAAFEETLCASESPHPGNQALLARYKAILDRVDQLLLGNPAESSNEELAERLGISVRTLQTACLTISGLSAHRYSRLKRLWAVRQQLRRTPPGLTVRASALAHGFCHMSQFTIAYQQTFAELPSDTLERARFGRTLLPSP